MSKSINLSKTVYELYKEDPEIIEVMKRLGFTDITNPGMLNTAGRFMTIPKGAAMKGIDLEKIKQELTGCGYLIEE